MNDMAASPRQIRFLESKGFEHVVDWSFEDAKSMVEQIAANGWRVPQGVNPKKYKPKKHKPKRTDTSVQPGPRHEPGGSSGVHHPKAEKGRRQEAQ